VAYKRSGLSRVRALNVIEKIGDRGTSIVEALGAYGRFVGQIDHDHGPFLVYPVGELPQYLAAPEIAGFQKNRQSQT
jgi:hypothetical protein